jgi:hypothetical protein
MGVVSSGIQGGGLKKEKSLNVLIVIPCNLAFDSDEASVALRQKSRKRP